MLSLYLDQRHSLWFGLLLINSIYVKRQEIPLLGALFFFL